MTEQQFLLSVALVPYLALVLVDGWMHEKSRRVPRPEQWIHAGIFVFIAVFLVGVFLDRNTLALAALLAAIPCLALDEFRFHGGLAVRERLVHYGADLALAGFAGVWLITAFT